MEVCIAAEDVTCQGGEGEAVAPTCDAIEVIYPGLCKNKSRSMAADEEEEVLHFIQIIKSDSMVFQVF